MTFAPRIVTALFAAAAAAALAAAAPAAAKSKLTLCNKSTDTYSVTALYRNNDPGRPESWKVYGWGDFPPGCHGVVQHSDTVEAYLSIVNVWKSGTRRIVHLKFGGDGPSKAVERFFCVGPSPFDRVLRSLDAHEECPAGWYHQLFNVHVRVKRNTNLDLGIGE